jgi:hypothetical protein
VARYEIQKWITGYAIRDKEEDVYIRDWQGNVVSYTLGDAADSCFRSNQIDAENKWVEYCSAMGYDPYPFDEDPNEWRDDDYAGYEEDYQESRYYPLDTVDYSAQNR